MFFWKKRKGATIFQIDEFNSLFEGLEGCFWPIWSPYISDFVLRVHAISPEMSHVSNNQPGALQCSESLHLFPVPWLEDNLMLTWGWDCD